LRGPAAAALLLLTVALAAPGASNADPIKTSLDAAVRNGFARLVFTMSEDDEAAVRVAGNVLIISFAHPISLSVDRLAMQMPDYIGAARRDPDGKAIRMALARKVTVNAMPAGEKLFVDLLPDDWKGMPPGLPAEVIQELSRRAREAERLTQQERRNAQQQKVDAVRVHVAVQPTFTRFVFDVSDKVSVAADRAKERLTLTFNAPIKFDLADAAAALPPTVTAINAETENDSTLVRFALQADVGVDLRTFRDGSSYVVDVVTAPDKAAERGVEPAAEAPATIAAQPQPAVAPEAKPVAQPDAPAKTAPAVVAPAAAPMAPAATAEPAPLPQDKVAVDPAKAEVPALPTSPPPPARQQDAAVAAPAAPARAARKPAAPQQAASTDKVTVELTRQGANLRLAFPFMAPVAAAVFHRADTLWIVFDSKVDIDLGALDGEASHTIRSVELTRAPDADIVRIKLDRPHLSSAAIDGPSWLVEIGDSVLEPSRALDLTRNLIAPNRASVTVPFEAPHQVHRIADPEVGDSLLVVTAFAPTRGLVETQDFIEFRALASTQGVVVEPLADDVDVGLAPDKVVVSRPTGLTLSTSLQTLLRGSSLRPVMFDAQVWGFDQQGSYVERQSNLIAAAAAAPANKRLAPRLDLARFYLARDMYPEAKGVLDVVLSEDRPAGEDVSATVLRAVTEVMMNRPDAALKDLADPTVGDQHDAPLWRALAYAGQGKWPQAREGFRRVEAALATLPVELQRIALKDAMRAAIEVGDFGGAANALNDFETIGVPHDMEPAMSVLIGRLAEGMGRSEDALSSYQIAADSWDRKAAAQGELRQTVLRYSLGDLKRDDVISALESLTTIWRGDETEIEALQILARRYTEQGRFRDSFYVMRSALAARPNSDMTRRIQQEAAATFDALFLAGKGDSLPAIDALALFYDFRELTPIGRRGDEMIRRLADRLVSVDLLDQAAELLQYQVDHRLQGAARAQVATRLVVIYLMNRKADLALATLKATRTADVSNELRSQRLLLEARALSDQGRHDLALEVIANVEGREPIRLRSDIYWAARSWRQSAEQIELMYGERWKQWQPLSDVERADILRAEIGFALGEDMLGLGRFREKYAAKMAQTPDARAFEIVSAPLGTSGEEFGAVAHAAASVDTLDGFLRDMQARYPEASAIPPAEASSTAPAPPEADAKPPQTSPAGSAPADAPSPPPKRAAGRTAQR